MARHCGLKRGLLARCDGRVVGLCVFCGRPFCVEHGGRDEDGAEVCVRETCQSKRVDLREHLAWKAEATNRSSRGFCGMEGCEGARWGQCSKCQAVFCERHLHDRAERIRQGRSVITRPASMCDHCLARNRLWAKV